MEEEHGRILLRFSELSASIPGMLGVEEAKVLLLEITACLGFHHYTYIGGQLYAGQRMLGWQRGARPLSLTNVPMEFIREYSGQRLDHIDPVLKFAMGAQLPCAWSRIYEACPLGRAEKQLIALAQDFQMYEGLAIPIHGPGTDFGIVSFAAPRNGPVEKFPDGLIALLMLLLQKFHGQLRALFASPSPVQATTLSRREIDVMFWSGEGKSAWEISRILSLSERTVEQYLNSSRHKLGAATKTEAVAKLMTLRYKEPI